MGTGIVIRNNITNGNDDGIVIAGGSQATVGSDNLRGADPEFVNEIAPDLRPRDDGSPAVDAANPVLVPDTDFNGHGRTDQSAAALTNLAWGAKGAQ